MAQRKKGDTQFERLHVRKICMPPDSTSQGVFTSSKGIVTFFILVKISSVNIIGNDEFTNVELSVFRAVFPRYTNAQTYYTNRKIMFPALKANIRRATKTCKLSCNTAAFWRGGGGGGGYTTKFYTWRFRPEIKPLNLLCAIFERKGIPSEKFH